MNIRKSILPLLVAMGLLFAVSACGGEAVTDAPAEEEPSESAGPSEAEETADVTSDPPEEDVSYYERALAGEYAGSVVTMFGPVVDEEAVLMNAVLAEFEKATGIEVQYEGSKEFEATISVRVEGGDPPDIADFPQPGLFANFAASGDIVDLNPYLDREYLERQYIDSWLDMATVDGPDGPIMGGVWHRINGKSLVWYPKAQWEAAGYPIPETWEELQELMDLMVEDGDTPWCIGIESGVATGWTATDWTEEMMLRTASLEDYDAWVNGELPFDSPEVRNAIEMWSDIWLNNDYVNGGRASIVSTAYADSPAPMFEDPPGCWMHKQGSFITSFFPDSAIPLEDFGFFYLPPIDSAYGRPFLVAGDIYAAFSDRPEVIALMTFFTKGESLRPWMASGGALSPHKDAELDWYGDPVERAVGEAIQAATSVRFDASDLMPGEVGGGSFWKGMTDFVSGSADLDTVLAEIDASWPR